MCSVYKEMDGRSRTYFVNNNMNIKGVCHALHPYLVPQQNNTNNDINTDIENRPPRNHICKDRFNACPAGGAHQLTQNCKDADRRKNKLRNIRRPQAYDVAANLPNKSRCRRSLLTSVTGNKNISIPRCGTSKTATYKAKCALGRFSIKSMDRMLPPDLSKR